MRYGFSFWRMVATVKLVITPAFLGCISPELNVEDINIDFSGSHSGEGSEDSNEDSGSQLSSDANANYFPGAANTPYGGPASLRTLFNNPPTAAQVVYPADINQFVTVGARVGAIEAITPSSGTGDTIVHFTFPVMPGDLSGLNTLVVRDTANHNLTTQIVPVTYAADGVTPTVVEMIVRVLLPVGQAPLTRYPLYVYKAVFKSPALQIDYLSRTPAMNAQLFSALSAGIYFSLADVFGNIYALQIVDPDKNLQWLVDGPLVSRARVYGQLTPLKPVGGALGTLPRFQGVHAYFEYYYGTSTLRLNLRVSNGHDNSSVAAAPVNDLYFTSLKMIFSSQLNSKMQYPDPAWNPTAVSSALWKANDITRFQSPGKVHLQLYGQQFSRRLALYVPSADVEATRILNEEYQAFDQPGVVTDYSWWNPATAHWINHVPIPLLWGAVNGPAVSTKQKIQSDLAIRFNSYLNVVTSGGNVPGSSLFVYGLMGNKQTLMGSYGGETGGLFVHLTDGLRELAAASLEGFKFFQIHSQMMLSRQTAFFHADGQPLTLDTFKKTIGGVTYVPVVMSPNGPLIGGSYPDTMGSAAMTTAHVNAVKLLGLNPLYETTMKLIQPNDVQHIIRSMIAAAVLVMMSNDPLSKDYLASLSGQQDLIFSPYPYTANGAVKTSTLKDIQNYVKLYPGQGAYGTGRESGWHMWLSNLVMRMSPAGSVRNDKAFILKTWVDVFETAKTCAGISLRKNLKELTDNLFDDGFQAYEKAFTDTALWGVFKNFEGADVAYANKAKTLLQDSLYANITYAWFHPWQTGFFQEGLHYAMAVGYADEMLNHPFCAAAEVPATAYTNGIKIGEPNYSMGIAEFTQADAGLYVEKIKAMYGGCTEFWNEVAKIPSSDNTNAGSLVNNSTLLAYAQLYGCQ